MVDRQRGLPVPQTQTPRLIFFGGYMKSVIYKTEMKSARKLQPRIESAADIIQDKVLIFTGYVATCVKMELSMKSKIFLCTYVRKRPVLN